MRAIAALYRSDVVSRRAAMIVCGITMAGVARKGSLLMGQVWEQRERASIIVGRPRASTEELALTKAFYQTAKRTPTSLTLMMAKS